MTPVAHLEPVLLAGTTVARASLHNEDEIKRLDLKIGDYVLIEKSGEIIPQVLSVVTTKRDGTETEFEFPTVCPVCGFDAVRPEGEAVAAAQTKRPAKIKGRIGYFASRRAMDIEGLGDVYNTLSITEWLKMWPIFIPLNRKKFQTLSKGEKSGAKLIEQIEAARRTDFSAFSMASISAT